MALPTKGRVIIETTAGEIDVELWSKVRPCPLSLNPKPTGHIGLERQQETPKTCRNFLALAMEGELVLSTQ
jgi:peptidyl-prolyl cis-trans isomerase SDCCAG10